MFRKILLGAVSLAALAIGAAQAATSRNSASA